MNALGFLGKWKAVKENQKAFEEYKKFFAKSSKALQKVERHCRKQKDKGKSARVRELASMSGHETRSKAKSSKASQKVERHRGKQKAGGKSARVRELASVSGHGTRSKGSLPPCQDMKPKPS
jgi:hypothetical protein